MSAVGGRLVNTPTMEMIASVDNDMGGIGRRKGFLEMSKLERSPDTNGLSGLSGLSGSPEGFPRSHIFPAHSICTLRFDLVAHSGSCTAPWNAHGGLLWGMQILAETNQPRARGRAQILEVMKPHLPIYLQHGTGFATSCRANSGKGQSSKSTKESANSGGGQSGKSAK